MRSCHELSCPEHILDLSCCFLHTTVCEVGQMMRSFAVVTVVTILSLVTSSMAMAKDISLTVGQTEKLKFKTPIREVRVIDPKIADVIASPYRRNVLTIVGVNKGMTDIYIKVAGEEKRYRVYVSDAALGKAVKEIKDFMGDVEGIYPTAVADQVVLGGYAYTLRDYSKAVLAAALFSQRKVRNYVLYKESAKEELNSILKAAGMTTVRARLISGMIFLEGAVGSKTEMKKLNAIIDTLHISVQNLVTMGEGEQVRVLVRFLEMTDSDVANFGPELPASLTISGGFQGQIPIKPSGSPTLTFDIQMPQEALTFKLNTLFKTGHARILAEPSVVCASGSAASLMVGGEVPIVVSTINGPSVSWKPYGVMLKLKPVSNSRGTITISVDTEISELDWSVAQNGFPGFLKRKVSTTVTLKDGHSLAISGFYKNNRGKSVSKIPLLGHIPILGELFKSRSFQDDRTNLTIILTPTRVKDNKIESDELIQRTERKIINYNEKLGMRLFLD